MKERITDKVARSVRVRQVIDVLDKGSQGNKEKYSMSPLMTFINELVQDAYIAGVNKVNLSETRKEPVLDTGEILVLAKNYCKDKGLSI